jgi:hypothetical protein
MNNHPEDEYIVVMDRMSNILHQDTIPIRVNDDEGIKGLVE